jgi:hypothetical protein
VATSLPTRSSGTEKAPPSLLTKPTAMGSPVASVPTLVAVVSPRSVPESDVVPSSPEHAAATRPTATSTAPTIRP